MDTSKLWDNILTIAAGAFLGFLLFMAVTS